jgi:ATP-dependent Clp protease protease subunit
MDDIDLRKVDRRLVERVEDHLGRRVTPQLARGAFATPVGMPAMPSPGGYMRYREMTIDEMLLENRVVFLVGDINHASAANCYMRLLYLQSVKRDQDINLYINSPGGFITDTLAVYDVMQFLSCDVATYCIGECASGGAIVLMAGRKGKRFILPNAKVMIHQPFGGVYGQAADVEIQAEQILKDKELLVNIMSKHTGQTPERIREESERDRYFGAKDAVAYGIVDEVLGADAEPKPAEGAPQPAPAS